MKSLAILIDLDGTLANISHRRERFLQDNNWSEFYSKIPHDTLNLWCKVIIDKFQNDYKIILLTGRKSSYEKETLDWLRKNQVSYDELYFRDAEDFRKDDVVKKEIYEKYIHNKYKVLFVVDDRQSVVKMWRSIGLTCLQCDEGNF